MKKRGELSVIFGMILSARFFGSSQAWALSIPGTYRDVANGSPGTLTTGLVTGPVAPIGSSLGGCFHSVTTSTTVDTGVTVDGFEPGVGDSAGLTLTFPYFLPQGLANHSAKYLSNLPTAAPEPATLLFFGATLVGLGSLLRRRIRRAAKTSV